MEDLNKIPRFALVIPLFAALINLSLFFWAGNSLRVKTASPKPREEVEILKPYPRVPEIQNPIISAESALVLDSTSGAILFSKNSNLRFSPASVTKIMTALVAINHYQPDEILTVDNEKIPGSNIRLIPGEKISVRSLLYGLMLNSGNDAAYTLAKNYPGGVKNFVAEMNRQAKKLNLTNTYFADPAGLEDNNNFTTTYDLVKLGSFAQENKTFAEIVATREKIVLDITGRIIHSLRNLNRLLWEVPGVNGIKTGFTEKAGGVLVTSFENDKRKLLIVVFKSEDRFQDTKNLIDWVFQSKKSQ